MKRAKATKKKRATKVTPKNKKFAGRHSKKNPSWGTPPDLVELVRASFGGEIDLDPFSSEDSNLIVKATRFFTPKENGFEREWHANSMLVNHPGRLTVRAWKKLMREYYLGHTKRAAWIGFSVEQLCILADEMDHPLEYSTVILRKRIKFLRTNGSTSMRGKPGKSPSHGNYITIIGMPKAEVDRHYGHLGQVAHGHLAIEGASGCTSDHTCTYRSEHDLRDHEAA